MKSISITRLKLDPSAAPGSGNTDTWNEKYLDYEIETMRSGKTRQSWTSWNEKYLDYEIETPQPAPYAHPTTHPWNEKYLDYEIETITL